MCRVSQLSLSTLISNDYLKNAENKPGFGAFSIMINPEKQTTGGKGQLLSWAFFMKGTIMIKGTYLEFVLH